MTRQHDRRRGLDENHRNADVTPFRRGRKRMAAVVAATGAWVLLLGACAVPAATTGPIIADPLGFASAAAHARPPLVRGDGNLPLGGLAAEAAAASGLHFANRKGAAPSAPPPSREIMPLVIRSLAIAFGVAILLVPFACSLTAATLYGRRGATYNIEPVTALAPRFRPPAWIHSPIAVCRSERSGHRAWTAAPAAVGACDAGRSPPGP